MTTINETLLTIDTVAPTLSIGQIQVSADKRGKDLTDAERIRRVVIPAGHWGTLVATMNGQTSQGLNDLLLAGLRDIANQRLRDILAADPMARTVALADFTVSALLAWNADTASTRGSLTFTREQVEEWYPTSKLFAYLATKGKAATDLVGNRLGALAAKNHGLKTVEDAHKLVTLLGDDATSALVTEMIQRLAHIIKSMEAKKADSISLADL